MAFFEIVISCPKRNSFLKFICSDRSCYVSLFWNKNIYSLKENVDGTTYFYTAPMPPVPPNLVIGTSITLQTPSTISITSAASYVPSPFPRPLDMSYKHMSNERVIPLFLPTVQPENLIFRQQIYRRKFCSLIIL